MMNDDETNGHVMFRRKPKDGPIESSDFRTPGHRLAEPCSAGDIQHEKPRLGKEVRLLDVASQILQVSGNKMSLQ